MLLFLLYSFAVGQMSVFLSGGSVTLWMTVGMDRSDEPADCREWHVVVLFPFTYPRKSSTLAWLHV